MNRLLEKAVPAFAWFCGTLLLAAIASVAAFLLYNGRHALGPDLLFGSTEPVKALLLQERVFDGIFPAIVGTVLLVALSVGWALPIGVAAGIYLAEYAGRRTKGALNLLIDILAGIPSIVVGLWGFGLAVFLHRNFSDRVQPCLLISSVALAFLVLPYIVRATQISLESLPAGIRRTARVLGATRLQNVVHVLLPQSLPGLTSGAILAIGRCAEDTAVILLTGAVATAGIPSSLLSRYEALPFYIYYISSQYADPRELATGYGASIVLLAVCLVLFLAAFLARKSLAYRALYRA